MDSRTQENADDVFHKEKNQKKTTDIRSDVNSLVDISTVVKGSTHVNSISEQLSDHQTRYKSMAQKKLNDHERNARLIRNSEIDDRLMDWIMTGLTTEAFAPWVAKCCHTLGLEKVNHLSINARNGKTPDRLFASLLKGAMHVHYKKVYYQAEQGSTTE